jgi:hypothetical protein
MGSGAVTATTTTLNDFIDTLNQVLPLIGRFRGVNSNSVNANATLINPLQLINIFNIGSAHHVSLPQANLPGSVPIGSAQVSLYNNGSAPFDVFDFAANNLGTVQVGEVAFCILFRNTTQEGTWQITKESIISGFTPLGSGGTGGDLSATGGTSKFLRQNTAGAVVDVVQPAMADISDYAQGTWTPTLTGTTSGSWVLSTAVGSYEKIGRQYTVRFDIVASSASSPVGNIQIGGLPATAANVANDNGYCFIQYQAALTNSASYTTFGGIISPNTAVIAVQEQGSGVAGQAAAVGRAGATVNIAGFATFHV